MRNLAIAAGVVLGLAVVGYVVARRAGQAIAANSHLVNPLDDRNVVYQGVNAVGAQLSGDSSFSLGGFFYDVFNPDVNAQIQALKAGSVGGGTVTIGYSEPAREVYPSPLDLSP